MRLAIVFSACILIAGTAAAQQAPVKTAPAAKDATAALPPGPGQKIVAATCGGCHGLDTVTSTHQSQKDWQTTVESMNDNGAGLNADDLKTVVDYLATNFGALPGAGPSAAAHPNELRSPGTPGSPRAPLVSRPAVEARGRLLAPHGAPAPCGGCASAPDKPEEKKIVLPDGPGKDLVSDACTQCHTLDRIVRQHMDATGWKGTVEDMETRGLDLTPADEASIVTYLAAHFGKQ